MVAAIVVSTVFLQAAEFGLDERRKYVWYRPYPRAEEKYYLMRGPVYGATQVPLEWFKTLAGWLVGTAWFTQGVNDPCVFIGGSGCEQSGEQYQYDRGVGVDLGSNGMQHVRLCVHVDDIIVRGPRQQVKSFFNLLKG